MNHKVMLSIIFVFLLTPQIFATETIMLNSSSFKVTVVSENIEYEWEYTNPNEYEFEKGNRVWKGSKAKREVTELFKEMDINENTNVEKLIQVIKDRGFTNFDRLDVRWVNDKEELYTWVWGKE